MDYHYRFGLGDKEMKWTPNKEDKRYINLIWAMCTDTLQSNGTDTKETFISNLRLICKAWEAKK